ncbi:MAG: beta-propeller domain-containing protein [Methanomicrobiales archaeon]|nr:beta-propeller domain-containing protein [Methanomicrobiales archaeon]
MIHPKIAAFTALCLVVLAILFGVIIISQQPEGPAEATTGTFTSAAEVKDYLGRMQAQYGQTGMYREVDGIAIPSAAIQESGTAQKSSDLSVPSISGTGYSTTNIQVAGVDEADFVKNDGKYIYIISGNELAILDAYPADKAKIISETPLTGSPQEMFLDGDRLVILTTSWDSGPVYDSAEKMAMMPPRYGGRSTTHALIYSLADRSDPELVRDITLTGGYHDARMIDGYVYAITSESVYIRDPMPMPEVRVDGGAVISPPIRYFDIPSSSYQYYTVSAFRTTGSAAPAAETYLLGYGTTLYVSGGNMYIAYQSTLPVAYAVAVDGPVIRNEETLTPRETTTIHRIAIGDGKIQYKGKGSVPGHLLNQFSMDEHGGNLRVATTVSGWSSRAGSMEYNNVYVLSEKMETVGKLEYLAPDERIYATRFIGDRLYMVTFKRIDPLFVIDLSDPVKPSVLGKLKIPGYSDYLHPYDQNHLIGIGKETEANEWGGVSVSGLKLALFDVSDVEHPKQVEALVIGEAGTDSEALRDHKAFLFDKEKNLLVIPVSENTVKAVDGISRMPYYPSYWQGAYVFGVNPDEGFTLRGKVRHLPGDGAEGSYWWTGAVMRSLYIDDTLYTVSRDLVVASDLADLSKPVAEIELPSGPQILRSGMME